MITKEQLKNVLGTDSFYEAFLFIKSIGKLKAENITGSGEHLSIQEITASAMVEISGRLPKKEDIFQIKYFAFAATPHSSQRFIEILDKIPTID